MSKLSNILLMSSLLAFSSCNTTSNNLPLSRLSDARLLNSLSQMEEDYLSEVYKQRNFVVNNACMVSTSSNSELISGKYQFHILPLNKDSFVENIVNSYGYSEDSFLYINEKPVYIYSDFLFVGDYYKLNLVGEESAARAFTQNDFFGLLLNSTGSFRPWYFEDNEGNLVMSLKDIPSYEMVDSIRKVFYDTVKSGMLEKECIGFIDKYDIVIDRLNENNKPQLISNTGSSESN